VDESAWFNTGDDDTKRLHCVITHKTVLFSPSIGLYGMLFVWGADVWTRKHCVAMTLQTGRSSDTVLWVKQHSKNFIRVSTGHSDILTPCLQLQNSSTLFQTVKWIMITHSLLYYMSGIPLPWLCSVPHGNFWTWQPSGTWRRVISHTRRRENLKSQITNVVYGSPALFLIGFNYLLRYNLWSTREFNLKERTHVGRQEVVKDNYEMGLKKIWNSEQD
jgi:hypothetical protein